MLTPAYYESVLDGVLELSNITGPGIIHQGSHCFTSATEKSFSGLSIKLFDEMLNQQRNIVDPFSQGRQGDAHDFKPIVKVIPEAALSHQFPEILIAGSNHAYVDFVRFTLADPLELFPEGREGVLPVPAG
jgi:hypothetical protein